MNLSIPVYGEKIESESSHWSFVIGHWSLAKDEGQMTKDKSTIERWYER